MRVVHILWSGGIGGKERALSQLVRFQSQHSRFRPAIAFGQAEGHYAELARQLDCPVIDLGMRNGHDFSRLPAIRRHLSQFDLHHFHVGELMVMMGSVACRGARRIYTHRGGTQAPGWKKKIGYRLTGLLLRSGFSALSANTRHAALAASAMTHIPAERWAVTYNGMDFDLLRPKRSRVEVAAQHGLQNGSRTIIGTTAHLRDLKRIDLLLEACASLPPESYQAVIVGDGPDRDRLESLSRRLGIREQTVFTGMQKDVADFLAAMDVFVLPSGPRESFGNSVVEAMAVGLPTIVFADGGGLIEHVEDGATGFVVNSVAELSCRLRRLIDEPALRAALGTRAATRARERYTLENMIRSYDRLYEVALGPARKTASACGETSRC